MTCHGIRWQSNRESVVSTVADKKSDTVIICNLVTEDTIDAKIYHRCLERIGVFESSIGECAGILGDMTQRINEAIFDSKLTQQEKKKKKSKKLLTTRSPEPTK